MSLFQGEFPPLWEHQARTLGLLREGAKKGYQCQLVMIPTGGGKTLTALSFVDSAIKKQSRALFLCDRKTLIAQTSNAAREVGLGNHGIIQANNPMFDMSRPFQIASVQTLESRGFPKPDEFDVVVLDEAHMARKKVVSYLKSLAPGSFAIGLSATPFTPGLAKIWANLINGATMHELEMLGVLVPMRIFSCRKPDMSGAETSGGEWTDKAAEERELVIVGDVISEWTRFAEGRKTIVFGATILHCEEMTKQFNEAGIPAATFCADTPDDERARILQEFSLGNIRVLISVEALAKGFDQKDIGCVCDCRPLRKSLSTAIQMWGRGLRSCPESNKEDCIARDTKILTNRGEVLIQDVLLTDKVWDGTEFVSHQGAICKGIQNVITYSGITATPDHLVKTQEGWRPLGDCAREQIPIVQTGLGGAAIRACEGRISPCVLAGAEASAAYARPGGVRNLRVSFCAAILNAYHWCIQWMQGLLAPTEDSSVAPGEVRQHGAPVSQPEGPQVGGLRWAWYRISVRRTNGMRPVDHRQSRPSRECQGLGTGPDRQRWTLRAWEYPLGNQEIEHGESQGVCSHRSDASVHAGTPGGSIRRIYSAVADRFWHVVRRNCQTVQHPIDQAKREVWDILNCGPRHCFTANGFLVHNCYLLDFSGNICRFADDFSRIYYNGLDRLDDGEKLDKEIRKDEEKPEKACPKCGYKPMGGRKCVGCGYEIEPKSLVEHLPGEMTEIKLSNGQVIAGDKVDLFCQLATYIKSSSITDPVKREKRAKALYHAIQNEWPPRDLTVSSAPEVHPNRATVNKIKSIYTAWAHRRVA